MFDKWQYWLFICNKCRKYLLRVRVVRGRPWMGQRGSTGESGLSRQWSGCTAVSYSVSVLLCCHLEWHELEHSRQELQQRFFEDYNTFFFILWHDIYSRKKWKPQCMSCFLLFFLMLSQRHNRYQDRYAIVTVISKICLWTRNLDA